MAKNPELANAVFLDTSFAIALSSPKDDLHQAALRWTEILEARPSQLVTTRAVMLEIGNALSKQKFRAAAVQLLDSLEADANVEIISLTDELYATAFALFRARPDKNWGHDRLRLVRRDAAARLSSGSCCRRTFSPDGFSRLAPRTFELKDRVLDVLCNFRHDTTSNCR